MKFYSYINEVTTKEVLIYNKIKKILLDNNVEPFLKEFGRTYVSRKFIWRGNDRIPYEGFKLKKTRKNRKPRFINQELHDYLSNLSKKLFGWDIRSEGVFTADSNSASRFGSESVFIPFGNYKYRYNSTSFMKVYQIYDTYGSYSESDKRKLNKLNKMYANDYKDKGLAEVVASKKEFEAIFKCDKYMLVLHSKLPQLIFEVMKEYKLV
jgi:hypothetical protein